MSASVRRRRDGCRRAPAPTSSPSADFGRCGGRSRPHVAASSAEQVVTSDAFATAWEEALRLSQTQVIAVLQAASYADRIILLADGRVVDDRGRSTAEQIGTMLPSMEALSAR